MVIMAIIYKTQFCTGAYLEEEPEPQRFCFMLYQKLTQFKKKIVKDFSYKLFDMEQKMYYLQMCLERKLRK